MERPSLTLRWRPIVVAFVAAFILLPNAAVAQMCLPPPAQACAPKGCATPSSIISVDPTNPHYFNYNGRAIALVGVSGEYVPHLTFPLANQTAYCTYQNYVCYVNDIKAQGLNKIRLWVSLNSSVSRGTMPHVAHEQPFKLISTGPAVWDLDQWDDQFFCQLKDVVAYCQQNDVVVEVALFDPWSPRFSDSPWNPAHNLNGKYGFKRATTGADEPKYFVSFDNAAGGINTAAHQSKVNQRTHERQIALAKKVALELDSAGLKNYYWEIANEPDFNSDSTGIDLNAMAAWHRKIAAELYDYESTTLGGRHRPITVNYHSTEAINTLATPLQVTTSATPVYIQGASAHYVKINRNSAGGTPLNSGIDLLRMRYVSPTQQLTEVFGLNETALTPGIQTSAEGARAEAWEFMCGGGGYFDHYGFDWDTANPVARDVRKYLGILSKFLNGDLSNPCPPGGLPTRPFTLENMYRAPNVNPNNPASPPAWAPSLPNYGSNNTYWGALNWTRNQYALYIHHSVVNYPNVNGGPVRYARYVPAASAPHVLNITLNLGSVPAGQTRVFQVDWINPATGGSFGSSTHTYTGTPFNIPVPAYTYDIALKIIRTS